MSNIFKPLGDRVLVCKSKHEESHAGIVLSESGNKEGAQTGKIVAVSGDICCKRECSSKKCDEGKCSIDLKIGDLIAWNRWSGVDIQIGNNTDDKYCVVKFSDILGIIKE